MLAHAHNKQRAYQNTVKLDLLCLGCWKSLDRRIEGHVPSRAMLIGCVFSLPGLFLFFHQSSMASVLCLFDSFILLARFPPEACLARGD